MLGTQALSIRRLPRARGRGAYTLESPDTRAQQSGPDGPPHHAPPIVVAPHASKQPRAQHSTQMGSRCSHCNCWFACAGSMKLSPQSRVKKSTWRPLQEQSVATKCGAG